MNKVFFPIVLWIFQYSENTQNDNLIQLYYVHYMLILQRIGIVSDVIAPDYLVAQDQLLDSATLQHSALSF